MGKLEYGIHDCTRCREENKLFFIRDMFDWRSKCAIAYDPQTKTILVNEHILMLIIQMVNPFQENRRLKLVSQNDFMKALTKKGR